MDEPPTDQSLNEQAARDATGRLGRGIIFCAGSIVAALIVFLFITYVVMWFQKPGLTIVGSIERWVYFIGNVVVVCYCFPAYRASKQRAFLYLAFAALGFSYSTLFTLLFGTRLPVNSSHSQLLLFYGLQHFIDTAGLILYAAGVISLAREAQRHCETSRAHRGPRLNLPL